MTTVEERSTMPQEREPNPATTAADRPIGYGRIQRKEDPRFVRGQGPLPRRHRAARDAARRDPALARWRTPGIVSIDTTEALAHPKVHAVITGKDLEGLNLAWAPTLSADMQAVLATDKVRFQGQEVAFVVAEDRYSARDALELIDVEYEELPRVIDARRALDPDAPVIRDDKEGKTDNHIFDWEAGDKAETDAVFARADVVVSAGDGLPAGAPGADGDLRRGRRLRPGRRQADALRDDAGAARPPHALRDGGRASRSTRSGSSRGDIGGGFGNKVGIYPGYVCAVVGSIVTGKPVKWVEDRSENLMSTSFARDYIMKRRGRGDEGR